LISSLGNNDGNLQQGKLLGRSLQAVIEISENRIVAEIDPEITMLGCIAVSYRSEPNSFPPMCYTSTGT
jgi:hypothetical protein